MPRSVVLCTSSTRQVTYCIAVFTHMQGTTLLTVVLAPLSRVSTGRGLTLCTHLLYGNCSPSSLLLGMAGDTGDPAICNKQQGRCQIGRNLGVPG